MGRKARDKKSRPLSRETSEAPAPADRAAPAARATDPGLSARVVVAASSREARGSVFPGSSRTWLLWGLALVAATVVTYAGSLHNPFLLDDPINIAKNPGIQKPLDMVALLRDPRAVVTLSLRWNFLAGGVSEPGYHVLNIAAHAIAGLLVFALASVTLSLPLLKERYADRATALAGTIALVFVLHPMQTESVTYIIQRSEIFVSMGLVGALLALAAMREGPSAPAMAALVASCLFGVYSKPSFVAAPVLLLAYDLCFLSRGRMDELRKRWQAFAVAVGAAVLAFALTRSGNAFEGSTSGFDIEGVSPRDFIAAQPGVVFHYFRVALWPAHLCFDCGYRGAWPVHRSFLGDSLVLPVLLLAILVAGALLLWKKRPLLTFAILGTGIVLGPTSSFVPLADFYVEHRMYLPIALLAMALVPLGHDLIVALAGRARLAPRGAAAAATGAAAIVLAGCATATVSRNRVLADPIRMMQDALVQAPENERVQYNLANALKRAGRVDEAIPHYEAAIRTLPNVMRSYENLGGLYLERGDLDKALETYLEGEKARPDAGMTHRNVANAYLRVNRPEEALAAAEKSLEVEPKSANGHRLKGDALMQLGRSADAEAAWRQGLVAVPGDASLKARLAGAH